MKLHERCVGTASLCIALCLLCPIAAVGQARFTLPDFLSVALREESDVVRQRDIRDSIALLDVSLSRTALLPSLSVSLSGPKYSQTTSPVTQPDGSVCYRRTNNMSESLSVGLSVPVNPTGGLLSLQSDISAYSKVADAGTTTSVSLNYFRLSFSQPLTFFSENKWNRRLLELSARQKSIESADAYAAEVEESMRAYFNMVICQRKDSLLRHEFEFFERLVARIERECSMGRRLEVELAEAQVKCRELSTALRESANLLTASRMRLFLKYGVMVDDVALWECPEFPSLECGADSMVALAVSKIQILHAYALEAQSKEIERLCRTRWGSPSLSANVGLSSSSSDLSSLASSVGKDYGAGFNFSVSISGLSNHRREMEKARLQGESLQLSHGAQMRDVSLSIREDFSRFDVLRETYFNNVAKEQALLMKLDVVMDKYRLHRVVLDDVEEVLSDISNVRISQIENIREAFLIKASIHKRVTY